MKSVSQYFQALFIVSASLFGLSFYGYLIVSFVILHWIGLLYTLGISGALFVMFLVGHKLYYKGYEKGRADEKLYC